MEEPDMAVNPLQPSDDLKEASHLANDDAPQTTSQSPLAEDSAMARAEKVEWKEEGDGCPVVKRKRSDIEDDEETVGRADGDMKPPPRKKGVASIRAEYLLDVGTRADARSSDPRDNRDQHKKNHKGQNTNRSFGSSKDSIPLCATRALTNEFSPRDCKFGDTCKYEHNLRKYLHKGKRKDLETFPKCPVREAWGRCRSGWRCRFAMSHAQERTNEDGRTELVLNEDETRTSNAIAEPEDEGGEGLGAVNVTPPQKRIALSKRQVDMKKAEEYAKWLETVTGDSKFKAKGNPGAIEGNIVNGNSEQASKDAEGRGKSKIDERAAFVDPPFRPSEKRRLYFGPETPVLAPLTTQGNLPFRRLCTSLGAQVTWSEMAMSLPLIQGQKSEWALMKAHQTELESPRFKPGNTSRIIEGYDNARDIKFGVQIAANKPWQALKATQVVTDTCPHLRAVDLNCGCPIDLVYRAGAGSALMDTPSKLERILRGMNAVSGEIPVQCKIRMGTKDNKPTADKLVERLAFGGEEAQRHGLGSPGVAAVTLHGRSRQQRYTKMADWSYIAQCASLIKGYNEKLDARLDTANEPEQRSSAASGQMYFIGNGDCYSHIDYYQHVDEAKVDSVMIARGALIKPWIFEEISTGQYLDKSSTERLRYIEQFVRFGLETWGSDEIGVGTTRRFLLEWLSFACRYVPIGLLEHLPPALNDRPPAYKGRDELETLMAGPNVQDWVKLSEMFLGPAADGFKFDPKHKSNSYDTGGDYTAEG